MRAILEFVLAPIGKGWVVALAVLGIERVIVLSEQGLMVVIEQVPGIELVRVIVLTVLE